MGRTIDGDAVLAIAERFRGMINTSKSEWMDGYADGIRSCMQLIQEQPTEPAAMNVVADNSFDVVYCKNCTKRGLSLCPVGLVGDMDYCNKARKKGQGL